MCDVEYEELLAVAVFYNRLHETPHPLEGTDCCSRWRVSIGVMPLMPVVSELTNCSKCIDTPHKHDAERYSSVGSVNKW